MCLVCAAAAPSTARLYLKRKHCSRPVVARASAVARLTRAAERPRNTCALHIAHVSDSRVRPLLPACHALVLDLAGSRRPSSLREVAPPVRAAGIACRLVRSRCASCTPAREEEGGEGGALAVPVWTGARRAGELQFRGLAPEAEHCGGGQEGGERRAAGTVSSPRAGRRRRRRLVRWLVPRQLRLARALDPGGVFLHEVVR